MRFAMVAIDMPRKPAIIEVVAPTKKATVVKGKVAPSGLSTAKKIRIAKRIAKMLR